MDVRSFVRELPKAELHLHLEGSLEPEMLMRLATRNRVEIPFRSVEEIRAAYHFTELQDFLDIYYQGMNVLRVEEDFYDLTMAYLKRAAADGAVHVEVFYDPQGHTGRGIPFATVTDGILAALADGREQLGITSLLILCILRHLPEDDGFVTLRQAEPWIADGRIAGLGLDSTEKDNPPGKFARLYAAAREAGLKLVAHAGEEGPAAYVADAVDRARGRSHRSRQPRARRSGAGAAPGRTGHHAHRLSAVQSPALRRHRPAPAPAEANARCGAQGHRQLGRPVLFRRLSAGQLRSGRRGAGARTSRTWSPWSATRSRARFWTSRPRRRIWAGSSAAPKWGGDRARDDSPPVGCNARNGRSSPDRKVAHPCSRRPCRPTATGASSRAHPHARSAHRRTIPELTCVLLSDAAGFITGQTRIAVGGLVTLPRRVRWVRSRCSRLTDESRHRRPERKRLQTHMLMRLVRRAVG